ncbi:MAG: response regulator [Verrucomicrobiota bacterium]
MPSGSPDRAKPTILVVDDDQGLLRLVTKALHREQFATASAASFQEAVDWLSQHTPDLMLLDLQLGDIGGKDLIDQLTVRGRNVPFIIITGQGDERMAVAMMKRGAIDYLIKDVDFLQFVPEVVRRALGQLERDKKLSAAEEALRRSEANLAKAQQIAHLGSYELNVASAPNDYYSDEIYRILGLDPGSAVLSRHEDFARMVHRDDHDAYRLALDGAIRNAAPFNLEYRVVRPDGAVRHVHTLGQPTLDATGRVAKFVGTLLDITDRKRAELRQKVLYTATQALAESSNLPEAAAQILKAVAETFGWDRGELWQVDAPAKTLWRVEAWPATRPSAAGPRAGRSRLSLGEDLPGRAWASREPVCGRIESETEPGGKAGDGMAAPRDAVGLPVLLGDEVLGVAVFTSRARPPADADLLEVFKVLGSQIGQFIERKRAEEALRKEHAFSSAVLDTSAARWWWCWTAAGELSASTAPASKPPAIPTLKWRASSFGTCSFRRTRWNRPKRSSTGYAPASFPPATRTTGKAGLEARAWWPGPTVRLSMTTTRSSTSSALGSISATAAGWSRRSCKSRSWSSGGSVRICTTGSASIWPRQR